MWEKQQNGWARHVCPDDTMSFSNCIGVGRAAYDKLKLEKYHSADILLDLAGKPAKLALHLHANGKGEFKVQTAQKARGRVACISCGGVMSRLKKLGYGPGRYNFRVDQPEFLVFDLDLPTSPVGGVQRSS